MGSEFTEAEKAMLIEGIGKAMGEGMKDLLPQMKKMGEENKKQYIERLTRIETKLDVLLGLKTN